MKRFTIVGVVLAIGATGSYAVLAQPPQQSGGMMGGGMMGQGGGMMNRGGPPQRMTGNNGGMMPMGGMMMARSIAQSVSYEAMVATSDGGVVVWADGKLTKYDSSLNLVKEAELNVDYETMQQRMQKMLEGMPMMRGGMTPMRGNTMGPGMMRGGMMGSGMMGGGMMGPGMMGRGMMGGGRSSWQAPSSAADRQNPVPDDRESVDTGKALFGRYCASCHGMSGKGSGIGADLTSSGVQDQTDGALFWKMSRGRSPMPSFEDVLTAHQRWDLVNYIRTLAPEGESTDTAQGGTTGGATTSMMQSGMDPGMMNRGDAQQQMMMGGMMPMGGMMAQSISYQAMAATFDGGVVVWANGKLMKYDSSLNLVKEVELNVDYETMQQRMQRMMENMPMRGGMMGNSDGDSGTGSAQP